MMVSRSSVLERLDELERLEAGWDGYGADPIDSACLDNVRAIIERLFSLQAPQPDVTPTTYGTISLDWEIDGTTLCVEVGNERYSAFLEMADGELETEEGVVSRQVLPPLLEKALRRLCLLENKPVAVGTGSPVYEPIDQCSTYCY